MLTTKAKAKTKEKGPFVWRRGPLNNFLLCALGCDYWLRRGSGRGLFNRRLHLAQDEEGEHGSNQVEYDCDLEHSWPAPLGHAERGCERHPNLGDHGENNAIGHKGSGYGEQNRLDRRSKVYAKDDGQDEQCQDYKNPADQQQNVRPEIESLACRQR